MRAPTRSRGTRATSSSARRWSDWPISGSPRRGCGCSCHNTIPHGRGLGSSSAAIVAGLLAASALAGPSAGPRLAAAARQRDRGPSGQRGRRDLRGVRAGVRGPQRCGGGCRSGRPVGRRRGASSRHAGADPGRPGTAAGHGAARRRRGQLPVGPPCWSTPWRTTPGCCSTEPVTGCTRVTAQPAMPRSYELVNPLRGTGVRRGDQRGRADACWCSGPRRSWLDRWTSRCAGFPPPSGRASGGAGGTLTRRRRLSERFAELRYGG